MEHQLYLLRYVPIHRFEDSDPSLSEGFQDDIQRQNRQKGPLFHQMKGRTGTLELQKNMGLCLFRCQSVLKMNAVRRRLLH